MSDNSKIEWTDATWNIVTGCSVLSPGCANCYAMKLAGTRLKHHPSREGLTRDTKAGPVWTGEVRFNEQWLTQPLQWKRPRKIFVCAHGDLFHEGVKDEWLDRIFAVMALCPQHVFQVLTKRADRMRAYLTTKHDECDRPTVGKRLGSAGKVWKQAFDLVAATPGHFSDALDRQGMKSEALPWPLPNVWLGVSVEDQARADERIPDLLATPAAVRWLSCEPLLGAVDVRKFMWPVCKSMPVRFRTWDEAEAAGELTYKRQALVGAGSVFLDWIVAGGESGRGARPMHPDWARSLRDQCAAAGVPFFFKQWGEWAPGENGPGLQTRTERIAEWDAQGWYFSSLTVRQSEEMHRDDEPDVWRFGKKAAGRLLDGVEHNGLPA